MTRSAVRTLLVALVTLLSTIHKAHADGWSFMQEDQQHACGLHKLTASERQQLLEWFTIGMTVDDLEQSAREYVENELGLSSDVYVTEVSGSYLILRSGHVLKMLDVSSFQAHHRYLADDAYHPDQLLDHDGNVQDVWEVYDDAEEALGDE